LPHGEAFSCSVTRGIEDVCSDAAKHLKIFYKNKQVINYNRHYFVVTTRITYSFIFIKHFQKNVFDILK
ncbi:MAG: hypothetical protein K0S27_1654, partial [Gammaproteobacteria bacterium]|nr:hypothetical protein [Gammaproteobacteria bacterium]